MVFGGAAVDEVAAAAVLIEIEMVTKTDLEGEMMVKVAEDVVVVADVVEGEAVVVAAAAAETELMTKVRVLFLSSD